MPAWISFLSGVGCTVIAVLIVAVAFDLRPARQADIRLTSIVRSAITDPDTLATNDLTARLAMPRRESRLLVSLLNITPSPPADWLAALTGKPPLSIDPGLVVATGQFLQRVRQIDERDRPAWFARLAELERIATEPDAKAVLITVGTLEPERRHALASSDSFRRLLEQIADIGEQKRENLLNVGLEQIPEDSTRASLLRALPTMDYTAALSLQMWLNGDTGQHDALRYTLERINAHDVDFGRLLSAYYLRDPILLKALRAMPELCTFTRACR